MWHAYGYQQQLPSIEVAHCGFCIWNDNSPMTVIWRDNLTYSNFTPLHQDISPLLFLITLFINKNGISKCTTCQLLPVRERWYLLQKIKETRLTPVQERWPRHELHTAPNEYCLTPKTAVLLHSIWTGIGICYQVELSINIQTISGKELLRMQTYVQQTLQSLSIHRSIKPKQSYP